MCVETTHTLVNVLRNLKQAGKLFKQKHKHAPVLVIDNLNLLPCETLETLQDCAKLAADREDFVLCFVSSEGEPLNIFSRKTN
jgi:hypothetical protein